jgi:hypothetical protein
MLFSFAACKNNDDADAADDTTTSSTGSAPIETDEKLLTVKVTLSPMLFEDKTPEEIKAEAKENGIKKCVINEDGSVTYTMTKAKRDAMLDEMKDNFKETYDGLINGEEKIESFVDIKAKDDFSQIDIYVNKAKYTFLDSMNAMVFYVIGVYYQCLSGVDFNEVDVVVNFIDNETEEVLDTASYKKFVENAITD